MLWHLHQQQSTTTSGHKPDTVLYNVQFAQVQWCLKHKHASGLAGNRQALHPSCFQATLHFQKASFYSAVTEYLKETSKNYLKRLGSSTVRPFVSLSFLSTPVTGTGEHICSSYSESGFVRSHDHALYHICRDFWSFGRPTWQDFFTAQWGGSGKVLGLHRTTYSCDNVNYW